MLWEMKFVTEGPISFSWKKTQVFPTSTSYPEGNLDDSHFLAHLFEIKVNKLDIMNTLPNIRTSIKNKKE